MPRARKRTRWSNPFQNIHYYPIGDPDLSDEVIAKRLGLRVGYNHRFYLGDSIVARRIKPTMLEISMNFPKINEKAFKVIRAEGGW